MSFRIPMMDAHYLDSARDAAERAGQRHRENEGACHEMPAPGRLRAGADQRGSDTPERALNQKVSRKAATTDSSSPIVRLLCATSWRQPGVLRDLRGLRILAVGVLQMVKYEIGNNV